MKHGSTIDIEKMIDPNVRLHPEISKWRDNYTVDLNLLNSIKEQGQIHDTVFRPIEEEGEDEIVELVSGARRYFHQKLLGTEWKDIPKKIMKLSDKEAYLLAASENHFRKDLNKWEEARVISDLILKGGFTVDEVAGHMDKTPEYVNSRLSLAKLPEEIRASFEKMDAPIGYSEPMLKLSKYPDAQTELLSQIKEGMDNRYRGIDTVDEANDFVDKTIREIKRREKLLKDHGACPKCGSKSINQRSYDDEDQLYCENCNHSWHKGTGEPWRIYEMKQSAENLGYEVELEEEMNKIKLTPKDAADILRAETQESNRVSQKEEEQGEDLPEKFRSKAPLEKIIVPLITNDNIQKVTVSGQDITIEIIEDPELRFTGYRKDYKAGEKARIEVNSSWHMDDRLHRQKVHEYVNSKQDPEE